MRKFSLIKNSARDFHLQTTLHARVILDLPVLLLPFFGLPSVKLVGDTSILKSLCGKSLFVTTEVEHLVGEERGLVFTIPAKVFPVVFPFSGQRIC